MRGKQLLVLAIILIALVAAVVLLKRPPEPTKLADEVGFERILPASFTADAIQGIDLYQGDQKDDTVQLRRQGDTWVAASYHNAPVKADKVSALLDDVSALEGEVRADKAAVLGDFKLQDAQALHVLLYTDEADAPTAHLLAGKSSGRLGFVRRADQNRVYSVNLNLRSEAGLYGDETDAAPEAKPWLDLQLHEVPKDHVLAVELQLPDRRLQLALNKPEPQKAAAPDQPEDEAKEDKADTAAATPPAKPTWELVEPKLDYALKQGVVDGLVTTLRTLRGDDVAAPDKTAEYGLDRPPYRAVLTLAEEGKDPRQVAIAVGKTVSEENEKRYARLEQDNSPVYLLSKWTFNQVFPTLGTILALDVLSLAPEDIVRVSWEQDGQSLALARRPAAETRAADEAREDKPAAPESKADTWQWVQAPEVEVDAEELNALLGTVERLTADDWLADTPAEAGLDQPVLTMRLTLRDGSTHHVTFGQARGQDEDRYVGVQGKAGTFVIAKASYTSIADVLKSLRPEPPAPAAAPEGVPKPSEAEPKPEMSGTEPTVEPTAEGATIGLPQPDATSEALQVPLQTRPAPLSAPNPTEGSRAGETPAAPAAGTESTPPGKADK